MDAQAIIDRAKNIIVSPDTEWDKIKTETVSNQDLVVKYALPFIGLGAVTQFIGLSLFGTGAGFDGDSTALLINQVIASLVVPPLSIIITAYVLNELAEPFNSKKDLNRSFKLVTYSFTPALIAAIIAHLSLYLAWVGLFGLYAIYLLWTGLPKMMDTPDDKKATYLVVAILVLIVTGLVLSALLATVSTVFLSLLSLSA